MALRLTGVTKRYGDQTVLDAVSLHVRPGDCYGFLGHNGAGKSTAMRVALGLVRPDAGRVLVEGFDAAEHPLEARARMGGLIEVPGFHGALSGRRNLVLLARLQGLGARAAQDDAVRVLEAVGLSHAADKAVGAYSHGMRQRLGIAQALLGSPRIVLLDEPTNGLDPEGIEEMRRLLRRLTREQGVAVLVSSHQLHEIEGVCNRIGILRRGRLLVEEETARLLDARSDRHLLRTGDDVRARAVVEGLGIVARDAAGGGLEIELSGRSAGDVARVLVTAGVELRALAPRATNLEEIYLRYTSSGAAAAPPATESPHVARPATAALQVAPVPPRERAAAPGPVRRTAGYDVRRWLSGAAVPLSIAAPVAVAALEILSESGAASASASGVATGSVATAQHATAFTMTARGLSHGLPLLCLAVAAIAALSLAGEFGRGTLRNVVLRPVGRARLVLGKALSALVAAAAGYVILLGASMAVAGAVSDFGDLVEILPGGQPFPYPGFAAADLWPVLWRSATEQFPAVLAFAGLGVAIGALARGGAGAVVGVFGTTLVLVGCPAILGRSVSAWLPSGHAPWLVTDASPTRRLYDLSTGVSNAAPPDARAVWVPVAWLAVSLAVACWKMRTREIP